MIDVRAHAALFGMAKNKKCRFNKVSVVQADVFHLTIERASMVAVCLWSCNYPSHLGSKPNKLLFQGPNTLVCHVGQTLLRDFHSPFEEGNRLRHVGALHHAPSRIRHHPRQLQKPAQDSTKPKPSQRPASTRTLGLRWFHRTPVPWKCVKIKHTSCESFALLDEATRTRYYDFVALL